MTLCGRQWLISSDFILFNDPILINDPFFLDFLLLNDPILINGRPKIKIKNSTYMGVHFWESGEIAAKKESCQTSVGEDGGSRDAGNSKAAILLHRFMYFNP